jgi:hypothetical protein
MERAGVLIAEPVSDAEDIEIGIGDIFYVTAFLDLDSERSYSEGCPFPIPVSKMFDYAKHMGLSSEETQDLIFVVRKMDNAHIADAAEKREKAMKDAKQNPKGIRKPNASNSKPRRGRG